MDCKLTLDWFHGKGDQIMIVGFDPGLSANGVAVWYIDNIYKKMKGNKSIQVSDLCKAKNICGFFSFDWSSLATRCNEPTLCRLSHNKEVLDGYKHLLKNTSILQDCDLIVIERQQPNGYTATQNLIRNDFNDKTHFISASARNARCGWKRKTDRWVKKGIVCDIAHSWLKCHENFLRHYCQIELHKVLAEENEKTMQGVMNEWNKNHPNDTLQTLNDFTWSKHYTNKEVMLFHDRADALLLILYFVESVMIECLTSFQTTETLVSIMITNNKRKCLETISNVTGFNENTFEQFKFCPNKLVKS